MVSPHRLLSYLVSTILLAFFLVPNTALSISRIYHLLNDTGQHTNDPDSDMPYLGNIKLGLAAALFLLVLVACGLPVLIIDCLQQSETTQSSNEPGFKHVDCVHSWSNSNHYDTASLQTDKQVSSVNHSQEGPGIWRLEHQNSSSSEPVSPTCTSPNPALSEHTDLLTGEHIDHASNSRSNRLNRSAATAKTRTRRLPYTMFARSSAERKLLLRLWFSRCNCFAAGIFLSSGFLELYVDVEESIEKAKALLKITSEFPFTPFLTLLGFFLILSIEQIVLTVKTSKVDGDITSDTRLRRLSSVSDSTPCETPLSPQCDVMQRVEHTRFSFTTDPARVTSPLLHSLNSPRTDCANGHGREYSPPSHNHNVPHVNSDDSFGSMLGMILLLCAMSIHSLFEGLAVGLQSTVHSTIALFSAILLHKLIIAAGIGINLATVTTSFATVHRHSPTSQLADTAVPTVTTDGSNLNRKVIFYQATSTFILASCSPLGVLIGWALMQQQQSGVLEMTTAALQGLACGTFFYVVFCELLPEEFREGVGDRIWKLMFLLFGFTLIVLYTIFMPH